MRTTGIFFNKRCKMNHFLLPKAMIIAHSVSENGLIQHSTSFLLSHLSTRPGNSSTS